MRHVSSNRHFQILLSFCLFFKCILPWYFNLSSMHLIYAIFYIIPSTSLPPLYIKVVWEEHENYWAEYGMDIWRRWRRGRLYTTSNERLGRQQWIMSGLRQMSMEWRSGLLNEVDVRRRRNEVGDSEGIKVGSLHSFLICTLCHHHPKGGIGQMYFSSS